MSDFTALAQAPLGGVQLDFGGLTIAEVTDRAILSVATPKGGEGTLSNAIAASFKTGIPEVGQSTTSAVANCRFLGMQQGLLFLLFDHGGLDGVDEVAIKLEDAAYLTDQSDSWVMIRVSGANSRAVFERICAIDLHPAAFPQGQVARTSMEHLGVIIIREGADIFLVMSPRSSAKSFLHALETSVRNIV